MNVRSAKILLFFIHRWLGIFMCLFFALWFASGIVMMYVEYPELTENERLGNLPRLPIEAVTATPLQAARAIHSESAFRSVSLTSLLGRPAYRFQGIDGYPYMVFADTGAYFNGLNEQQAISVVEQSGFADETGSANYLLEIEIDQWSISSALDRHRPLHKVAVNDEADTMLYLSNITGEVVLDTHRNERFWNWLGSTIHWIYPVQLRQHGTLWNKLIICLSIAGIISVVSGTIAGIIRLRVRNRAAGGAYSPYDGWMHWHHIVGLLSVIVVGSFIFSGLMSMGPWGIFNPESSAREQLNRYTGGAELRLFQLPMPAETLVENTAKEIQWHQIANERYFTLRHTAQLETVVLPGLNVEDSARSLKSIVERAIPSLLPDARLTSIELLHSADNYYYSRRGHQRPLPVYRAKFDDDEFTWYHIDVTTGQAISRVTDASRRERWLFNGLHSLDYQFLLQRRPLWDITVILLSLLGLGFSLTAIVIAWRKLTR